MFCRYCKGISIQLNVRLLITTIILILSLAVHAQRSKVLSAQQISKLLPSKIPGYYLKGIARSSEMKIGTLTYSLCERNFAKGKRQIRILLFDYIDAPIMYQQMIRNQSNMTPVENDSIIYKPMEIAGGKGWQSVNTQANESKLILGLYERYYLSIEGDNIDFTEVMNVFNQIDLKKFPH
jgi:hypothetical protein